MSKLVWDKVGERLYETGVSKGVVYPQEGSAYPKGTAWNGLTAINESPEGAEANAMYADNIKYLNILSAEEFKATIEAYMYPDEFKPCIGAAELVEGVSLGQQDHKTFGLSYQTIIGNDVDNNAHGYKIHLVYGCLAAPSEADYSSVNDSPEAATMSWEVSTTPVEVDGFKPTATLVLDSTKLSAKKMAAIEKVLYGDDDAEARLPLPNEVKTILAAVAE